MDTRKGEKLGWSGGWAGSFLWVIVLAVVFFMQGKYLQGFMGLLLFTIAMFLIKACLPWKHPRKPYWQLMLLPYSIFILAFGWVIWSFSVHSSEVLAWWHFLMILPTLMPFIVMGKRTWVEP